MYMCYRLNYNYNWDMNKLSGFGILAGVGLILANQCIYTVNPGERVNHNLFT